MTKTIYQKQNHPVRRFSKFLERSCNTHGTKYDYTKVNYIDNTTKVEIICPEHSSFWQIPINHLDNHGCTKCYKESSIKGIDKFTKDSKSMRNGF